MNDPNPANYPFLVQGDGLFSVRRCTDGFYRIVRWEDLTYLTLPPPTSKVTQTFYSVKAQ
jgi:hypothetical protein